MTPQAPDQEYIITETLIRQWRGQCMKLSSPHTDDDDCKKCAYRGKGVRERCCDLDDSDFEKMFRSRPAPSPAAEHAKHENISDHSELKLPPTKEWTLGMVYAFEAGLEEGKKQAAAQAREDSMVEIVEELHRQFIGKNKSQILDIIFECQINPVKWLKSLRTRGEPR